MSLTAQEVLELKAKRSQLADQYDAIIDAAGKAKRVLTKEEGEKTTALLAESEGLANLIAASEKSTRDREANNAPTFQPALRDDTRPNDDIADEVPEKDIARYSILKVIRCQCEKGANLNGIELELHQELARRAVVDGRRSPRGIMVPTSIMGSVERSRRARIANRELDTSTGAGAIKTAVASFYIDLLRPMTVLGQLGITMMGGLVGTFGIPRQTAGASTYWVTDGQDVTPSNQTLGQVTLSPKCIGAYTDITRSLAVQSSIDVENFVRNDLFKQLAVGLDKSGFSGSGTSGQPIGLFNNTNVPVFNSAAAPTWKDIVALETTVANANVTITDGAYVSTPAVRGLLKATPKISSQAYPIFIWGDNNEMNGYEAVASNVIPGNLPLAVPPGSGDPPDPLNLHGMVFGNWIDMIMGMWGGVDLLVDPYSLSKSGGLRIVILQDADIQLRHNESFAVNKTIDASGVLPAAA
ncbi:MAG: phage major capsid protein [Phycisphaerales bacterium]|nr:phage major capsid protein [Phycisphaerales bacterium]